MRVKINKGYEKRVKNVKRGEKSRVCSFMETARIG